jgi:DNA-binding transcriptional ArsR family regulator
MVDVVQVSFADQRDGHELLLGVGGDNVQIACGEDGRPAVVLELTVQDYFTIDLDHLRVLRESKERGTVTATAAALHLGPSAVSQQLRALLRALGVPLTEHDGRRAGSPRRRRLFFNTLRQSARRSSA